MKTIGLMGGMSWESSADYYRIINETVKEKLGGLHSARCLMFSFDFEEIERLQHADRWDDAAQMMIEAARNLERGGADFLVICTNTMHKLADQVQGAISIPLLHIADATAEKIQQQGLKRIGLLGTRFTMEHDFYRGRLIDRFGLDVIIPDQAGRDLVHRVVYDELCLGIVKDDSRREYVRIISEFAAHGGQAVILGCTEIGMLIKPEDSPLPVFDTTRIHAVSAVEFALQPVI